MRKIGTVTILETNPSIGPLIKAGLLLDVLIDDRSTNPHCLHLDYHGYRCLLNEAVAAGVKLSEIKR